MDIWLVEDEWGYKWYPDTIIYDPPFEILDATILDESEEENCSELTETNDLT